MISPRNMFEMLHFNTEAINELNFAINSNRKLFHAGLLSEKTYRSFRQQMRPVLKKLYDARVTLKANAAIARGKAWKEEIARRQSRNLGLIESIKSKLTEQELKQILFK